jgi:branched-chain amino acid transport system ATP-binding protein
VTGADDVRPDQRPVVLEASNLTVAFGAIKAVDGVSLTVHADEVVGLIGPNGAGKSTFMDAISGFAHLQAGQILVSGRDVRRLPPHARARLGIARTFQHLELFATMTVVDNIRAHSQATYGLFSGIWRRGRADQADRVDEVIDVLGLGRIAHQTVGELSYPDRKLVEFARAMAADIEVLLLDEPMAGIAAEDRPGLIATIGSYVQARRISVLLVEHDMKIVSGLCDRVYVMDSGRQIAVGTFDEIIADDEVRRAYLGIDSKNVASPEG